MITYFNIANSNEMRHPFKFDTDQSSNSPLSCSFEIAKGGETAELCITLEVTFCKILDYVYLCFLCLN